MTTSINLWSSCRSRAEVMEAVEVLAVPIILNLGSRWGYVINLILWPPLQPHEIALAPTELEAR
jgi:hypothetical protein